MKPPSIPKGWRVLRKGTVIRKWDKFLTDSDRPKWLSTSRFTGYWKVGDVLLLSPHYIRRKQPKTK